MTTNLLFEIQGGPLQLKFTSFGYQNMDARLIDSGMLRHETLAHVLRKVSSTLKPSQFGKDADNDKYVDPAYSPLQIPGAIFKSQ